MSSSVQKRGIAIPNMWIKIGSFSASTAKSEQVDTSLGTTQQLLELKESIERDVDPSVVGGLFASGQLAMGLVTVTILREGSLAEVVNSLATGAIIPQITVFRTSVIQGKDQKAEQLDYYNCIVTGYESDMRTMGDGYHTMYTATFSFRPTKRVHTIIPYDSQTGAPGGNKVSSIDFVVVGMSGTPATPSGGGGSDGGGGSTGGGGGSSSGGGSSGGGSSGGGSSGGGSSGGGSSGGGSSSGGGGNSDATGGF